jgi:hypothetical protein
MSVSAFTTPETEPVMRLWVTGDKPNAPLVIEWPVLAVTARSVVVPRSEHDARRVRDGVILHPSRTTMLDRALVDGPRGSIWSNTIGRAFYTEVGVARLMMALAEFAEQRRAKRTKRAA